MPEPHFEPPVGLRNAHLQTLRVLVLGRSVAPLAATTCRVFHASDGEPLVALVDWQPGRRRDSPAAVLVHGLEGSATSLYMRGTARKLYAAGWHVVRLNQRGCGDGEGLTATLHHGGRSDDVLAVLTALARDEGVAALATIGFSLGGNLVLKMAGELGRHAPGALVAVAALSPLLAPAHVQEHLDNRHAFLYRRFFLRLMAARLRRRARLYPQRFPAGETFESETVRAFDDRFTAPLCGFASALDYYRRADALPLLGSIHVPSLLVHAQDDPIVPFAGFSARIPRDHGALCCVFPERGGHLGFYAPAAGSDGYWAEDRAVAFVRHRARSR
jgi:predicted alpha/beta-fold hydrolase